MKSQDTASSQPNSVHNRQHRAASYQKVFNARKQPIRGLWIRNGRFYAQLTVEDPNTGAKQVRRVPLEGASTVAEAEKGMRELMVQRERNDMPELRRAPKFSDYAAQYEKRINGSKRASTVALEKIILKHWKAHLGERRLNHIQRRHVNDYIAQRRAAGRCPRTVNLEIVVFRNVMKAAIDDDWIRSLPTENLRPIKWTPPKRALISLADIERLCAEATKTTATGKPRFKNGQELSDYIHLMVFCGSRRGETLRLKWADVDFERGQLTIGADGQAKNHRHRVVDFNDKLEAHLKDMATRRQSDSEWIFPSPQCGDQDRRAKTFVQTMRLVRFEAKLPRFGFHDCRHYFISYCVMSGIDYMTIAKWVGHSDGGVLIGKVYGHLANDHARRQAKRIVFEPVVLSVS